MKGKKKFSEVYARETDIYVQCSLYVTDKDTSEWGYTFSLFGNYVNIDEDMTAEEMRHLVACLTSALKATGEWKEEGGAA